MISGWSKFHDQYSNQRNDEYGGSPENRNRFVLGVAEAVVAAIGKDKVGIRLSPFGAFNDIKWDDTTETQFVKLAEGLKALGIVYIHLVDHASMGAPAFPQLVKYEIRNAFGGTIIMSGGYDADKAEADLAEGKGELVAFGRPFISNPDLVERFKEAIPLSLPDQNTFYTPGEKEYSDYEVALTELSA